MFGLPPGEFEHGAHQMHEKAAMTDNGNPVLGLVSPVGVAGQQVSPKTVGAWLAFFVGFKWTIPPTAFVEVVRQGQLGGSLLKIRARFARQSGQSVFFFAAKNSTGFVNFRPGRKGDLQCARNRQGGVNGALHQAAIQVRQAKSVPVVNIPTGIFLNFLVILQKIGQEPGLAMAFFGPGRV